MNYALFQCMRHDLCLDNEIKQGQMLRRKANRQKRDQVLRDYLNAVSETVTLLKQNRTFYYD